jgi:hypothetical protein
MNIEHFGLTLEEAKQICKQNKIFGLGKRKIKRNREIAYDSSYNLFWLSFSYM